MPDFLNVAMFRVCTRLLSNHFGLYANCPRVLWRLRQHTVQNRPGHVPWVMRQPILAIPWTVKLYSGRANYSSCCAGPNIRFLHLMGPRPAGFVPQSTYLIDQIPKIHRGWGLVLFRTLGSLMLRRPIPTWGLIFLFYMERFFLIAFWAPFGFSKAKKPGKIPDFYPMRDTKSSAALTDFGENSFPIIPPTRHSSHGGQSGAPPE